MENNKGKVLYFEGAGMDYTPNELNDVGNHRIRTAFKNLDGTAYYLELGNVTRFDKKKKSKELPTRGLHVMHLFRIEDRDKDGYEMKRDYKSISLIDFTKKNITKWINENLHCSFDTIDVLDDLSGYNVHGDYGKYNLIDDFKIDFELIAKRREAYDKVDMEYRKALGSRYTKIHIMEMDENSITIRCYDSDENVKHAGVARIKNISLNEMEERTVKTYENWVGNLDDYLQVGDLVDEEMYEYFLNVLPPAYDTSYIIQIGEPCSHINGKATYSTLVCTLDGWEFRGECFRGETKPPSIA